MGSVTMQCYNNGTCSCREGFMGYKCDQCEPNYFHNRATHQCEECPICYSLIRDQVMVTWGACRETVTHAEKVNIWSTGVCDSG